MNILKSEKDREEERVIAKLRNLNKEASQREYILDVKPSITADAKIFSNATDQDYSISRVAVNKIIKKYKKHYDVEISRVDNDLEIRKNGQLVETFPLGKKLSKGEVIKRNLNGSFLYGRAGTDIFSIIPPGLQNI